MSLFSTTGIRGPADTFFTDDFCLKIGYAFGMFLKKKGKQQGYVAVAMDPRESSPRIKAKMSSGLALAGFEILDQGVIPTPALTYYAKQSAHIAGAVMVTGSHVVANLNGLKFTFEGEEITKAMEVELETEFDLIKSKQFKSIQPSVKNESAGQELYLAMLTGLVQGPYPKWKIFVDTTNGAQTEVVRELFNNLKIKVIWGQDSSIQADHFVPCDTDVPKDFMEPCRQVLLNKADFGLVFDVDGDRVIFIDDLGRFVHGDISCTLLAQDSDSKSIVTTISASSAVDHIGKRVYRTAVGSTLVAAKMKETGCTFGFETNGGGISAEIIYGRDGASTAIKMLNLLKKSEKKLSQIVDSLYPHYYFFRDKITCQVEKYAQIYAVVDDLYSNKQIDSTDGRKVYLTPDEWILFRASGTAPEFRVFVQSLEQKRASYLGQKALDLIRRVALGGNKVTSAGTDTLGVFTAMGNFPNQVRQVLSEMPLQYVPSSCNLVSNIVVSGMGGSALGGRILANLERQVLRVPLVVSTEYHLPNFVDEKTLVVISSYSGNTEETLTSLNEAIARNAQIFVIASGGKLAELAIAKKLPNYIFDPKFNTSGQPRLGLGYNIMALVCLLARCQLINPPPSMSELPEFLAYNQKANQQLAEGIAGKLVGKMPFILASEHLKGVAHDFKNQLNENAKNTAVFFDLPEADHHLLEGLSFPKNNPENIMAVFFTSDKYHPEVKKRYGLTESVFTKQKIMTVAIPAKGPNVFFESMYLVQLSSYISFFMSQLNGIDPGPIPWVDFFKSEIDL